MPKHFSAIVTKGRHSTQPFSVTIYQRVDSKIKQRYSKEWNAVRGAVRQFRDQLLDGKGTHFDKGVLITLPGGRYRMGWYHSGGKIVLDEIINKKP